MNTSIKWRVVACLGALATVTALLSGCSSSVETTSRECAPSGNSSATITKVTPANNFAPRISFPTPLHPQSTEVRVFSPGHGKVVSRGHIVELAIAGYNGVTGKSLYHPTGFSGDASDNLVLINPASKQLARGLQIALSCVRNGEKFAAVVPASELMNKDGQPGFGLSRGQSAVFYFEVKNAFADRATGDDQLPNNAFPTVTLAPNGQPGIAALDIGKLNKARYSVLKLGKGKKLGLNNTAVVQYTMFNGATGQVSSTTWGTDTVALWQVNAYPGIVDALSGARVGSQLIVLLPKTQAAQVEGTAAASGDPVPAVIVIDVLGTRSN